MKVVKNRRGHNSLESTGIDGNFPAGLKANTSRAAREGLIVGSHLKIKANMRAFSKSLQASKIYTKFEPVTV
ncbi:hypothetical protein ADS77_12725 [Pseudoalteromonas porphyrae]|uniref:Uncharacterized protein n=1 Tax=Pseudoalteromonas porphyrae TaxID=187330 RepID=A0A0N0LZD6_9GAMM|nr:hypothetical protein ADS77_12725 [Pseudoalteromonas porphyrae]